MKKVLILAFDFPPYASIGGQRPCSWYRYFRENNYEPIVVTRHWNSDFSDTNYFIKPSSNREKEEQKTDLGTIIRVPYTTSFRDRLVLKYGMHRFVLLRKMLSFGFGILLVDELNTIRIGGFKLSKPWLSNPL